MKIIGCDFRTPRPRLRAATARELIRTGLGMKNFLPGCRSSPDLSDQSAPIAPTAAVIAAEECMGSSAALVEAARSGLAIRTT
jgi:hypothetical protein